MGLRQPVARPGVDDVHHAQRQEIAPWVLMMIFTADPLKIAMPFGPNKLS
jgi:hypothetical protein